MNIIFDWHRYDRFMFALSVLLRIYSESWFVSMHVFPGRIFAFAIFFIDVC